MWARNVEKYSCNEFLNWTLSRADKSEVKMFTFFTSNETFENVNFEDKTSFVRILLL
jgi:hypothetical protein